MSDDEIIGVKSTSIKFKNDIGIFVSISYLISSSLLLYLFKSFFGLNLFTFFLIIFILTLIYQLIKLREKNPQNYLNLFKFNNYTGLSLFLGICLINF